MRPCLKKEKQKKSPTICFIVMKNGTREYPGLLDAISIRAEKKVLVIT
jgi:hypothetical protein